MPVVHEGLESELAHVENPDEQRHIRALWDEADPMMQEMCQNGRPIPLSRFGPASHGEQVRAYSRSGEIIALLSCDPARGGWKPDKVLVPL